MVNSQTDSAGRVDGLCRAGRARFAADQRRPSYALPALVPAALSPANDDQTIRTRTALFAIVPSSRQPQTPGLIARAVAFESPKVLSPMAGYFSNHSQSRFLANSNNGSLTTTTATTQSPASANPPGAARPRVPSSKHFSTFVSTASGDEKAQGKDRASGNSSSNGTLSVHPLRNTYVRMLQCAPVFGY